jgi:molybdate transport system permease protein
MQPIMRGSREGESPARPDGSDAFVSAERVATSVRRFPRQPARWQSRLASPRVALWLSSAVLLAFLLLPLTAIFIRAIPSGALGESIDDPVVREALTLSMLTTTVTLVVAVVLGTPVAWLLARYRFRGRDVLDTLIDLPMVLPPAVAGVALLMAFGRRGTFGPFLSDTFGIELPFTTAAVVLAQAFVATPFYVKAAKSGFESVDRELEHVATTLGVSRLQTFWSITVPLALPALLGGAVMCWARALGEFGATIMFAGNFMGRTQTMPLAIYQTMESGRLNTALVLSGILVVVSFTILIVFKALARYAAVGAGVHRT